MALSDTAARNAKPTEKTYRICDSGGLYLEILAAGGKYWRWKYRYLGKEKRLALGVYPTVSLKAARDRRDAAKRLLAERIDPGAHRKAVRATSVAQAANSFEVVGREWFERQKSTWADTHTVKQRCGRSTVDFDERAVAYTNACRFPSLRGSGYI